MSTLQKMREKKWHVISILLVAVVIILGILSIVLNTEQKSQMMSAFPKSSPFYRPPKIEPLTEAEKLKIAIAEQTNADKEYVELKKANTSNFPWLNKLPLAGDKYYVYFDIEKSAFVATVYPSTGDNVDQIKQQVVKDLQEKKQIPAQQYEFEWVVYEKK